MDRLKTIIKSSPFIIAFIYVIVGFIWIQYSDQLVLSLFENSETITKIQSLKGWFFVAASGVLIFILIKKSNDLVDEMIMEVKRNRDKFRATFENAPIGIAHHKPNEKWIFVNRTLSKMLGYKKDELLKLRFKDFIHPDDFEGGRELDAELISGKISSYTINKKYKRKDGSYFTGKLTKAAVKGNGEKPQYLIAILEDITSQIKNQQKLKDSLKEKEVLLSEVHHRVKNNIALMFAFLELQLMYTQNQEVIEILEHYKTRLKTLSLIHEKFSGNEKEAMLDFKWYLHKQIDYITQTFKNVNPNIDYRIKIEETDLNINQAIPVGLICNELLISANYQGFENSEKPFIDFSLQTIEDSIKIIMKSNGEVVNNLFDLSDPNSLDSKIIESLVNQVEGDISFSKQNDYQAYTLTFRKKYFRGAASYIQPNS